MAISATTPGAAQTETIPGVFAAGDVQELRASSQAVMAAV